MANITTFRTVSTFRALSLASDSAVICVTEALASDGVASFGRSFLALARLLAIQTETAFRTGGIACVVLKSGATRTFACKVSVKDGKRFKNDDDGWTDQSRDGKKLRFYSDIAPCNSPRKSRPCTEIHTRDRTIRQDICIVRPYLSSCLRFHKRRRWYNCVRKTPLDRNPGSRCRCSLLLFMERNGKKKKKNRSQNNNRPDQGGGRRINTGQTHAGAVDGVTVSIVLASADVSTSQSKCVGRARS